MDKSEIKRLLQKRRLLVRRIGIVEEYIRGSVVLMRRKCSRARCARCSKGEGHPTWVMTRSEGGRTRTIYIGEKRLAEARRLTANYRRVAEMQEEVARINLALLKAEPSLFQESDDERGERR